MTFGELCSNGGYVVVSTPVIIKFNKCVKQP